MSFEIKSLILKYSKIEKVRGQFDIDRLVLLLEKRSCLGEWVSKNQARVMKTNILRGPPAMGQGLKTSDKKGGPGPWNQTTAQGQY